jgi:glycosyltransferase involved in cell wall biosynthesis
MKILLINYDFPPNPGIGGRRWAKLAKYLALKGHQVFVVKAELPQTISTSTWEKDVSHPNIQVYNAARKYPRALSHPKEGWMGKIKFHAQKRLMQWREKGTIYDQSIGWHKTMFPSCRSILQNEKIDAIVATGAPWNLLVYAAQLKMEFPHVRLLADYRDPWLTAKNYGMAALKNARMNAEIKKQQFVFEHVDLVTTPYEYLTAELKSWSAQRCKHQPSFVTLPHFFDNEDFQFENAPHRPNDVFRVVYAGDIYVGSEPQWKQFQTLIESLEHSLPSHTQMRFDIYTHAKMPTFISGMKSVHLHVPIGKDIFHVMNDADALLIVLPENKKNERTTKFFEYLPLRKPLLIVAPAGEVTQFVETNRLGIHASEFTDKVQTLISGTYAKYEFNNTFDIQSQTAKSRATELIELLA